jgi:ribulose-5-phosphate 4-epimerase/fuculose-1-phosphate aldolase
MSSKIGLVVASRTLAAHGVIDAYGHASVRCEHDRANYYMACAIAPELIREDDIITFDLDSQPLDARDRSLYHERFIHGEIYKARPGINAVVHSHAPAVAAFSCTRRPLQPVFHMAAFVGLGVPVWDIRDVKRGSDMLVREPPLGQSFATLLAHHPAALMRGHGCVVVGETLARAVGRAIYLEMNARMQLQAIQLAGAAGEVVYLDDEEVAASVARQNYDRAWELWKHKALAQLDEEVQAESRSRPHNPAST